MSIGIYKITNKINGKIYIGQSKNIEQRWGQHRKPSAMAAKTALAMAFTKYGKDNFFIEVVEECSLEELNDREVYWINELGSFGTNGYNITPGGGTQPNSVMKKYTKEQLNKVIQLLEDNEMSNREISISVGVHEGFVSSVNCGRSHVQDREYPIRPVKLVYAYNLKTKDCKTYTNMVEASTDLRINKSNINNSIRQSRPSQGFIFSNNKDDINNTLLRINPELYLKEYIVREDGKIYNSFREAARGLIEEGSKLTVASLANGISSSCSSGKKYKGYTYKKER